MILKNKMLGISMLFIFLLSISFAFAEVAVNPSTPSDITAVSNTTNDFPLGWKLNNTRGYIYTINITESAPSSKWLGYVGNIDAEYALQNSDSEALYDWDIVTVTGEVYATKEASEVAGPRSNGLAGDDVSPYGGGIPYWPNVTCANSTMIGIEESLFNHTSTDEDTYSATFTNGAAFDNPGFYAGDTQITDTSDFGGNCFGAMLNVNNTDNDSVWYEIVLTDGTYQYNSDAESALHYDITYAALINNNALGYNEEIYDFQILLPQSGLEGNQPNVPFYFYVELI
jgi:hypothetical protein